MFYKHLLLFIILHTVEHVTEWIRLQVQDQKVWRSIPTAMLIILGKLFMSGASAYPAVMGSWSNAKQSLSASSYLCSKPCVMFVLFSP